MFRSAISMFIKSSVGMMIIIALASYFIYQFDMLDATIDFFQNFELSGAGKNILGIFEEDDYEVWKCEEWKMLDECKK